ncbi:MAG: helix-turn-helix transcriptional regulator [Clostridia bacterium]|nr:helix-turn-helix transcriptional regulator [Clostridia bacterium]
MDLGNKIFELRKSHNLSQEQLAEKVDVARQTISKWELGETAPDIKQAQTLSEIFGVSLDELTGNGIKNAVFEKVSNTERLAGMAIKILKVLGVLILISIASTVIGIISLTSVRQVHETKLEKNIITINETVDEEEYYIAIGSDRSFESKGLTTEMKADILEMTDFSDLNKTYENIKKYFILLRDSTVTETTTLEAEN